MSNEAGSLPPWSFFVTGEPELCDEELGFSVVGAMCSVYPIREGLGLSPEETVDLIRGIDLICYEDLPVITLLEFLAKVSAGTGGSAWAKVNLQDADENILAVLHLTGVPNNRLQPGLGMDGLFIRPPNDEEPIAWVADSRNDRVCVVRRLDHAASFLAVLAHPDYVEAVNAALRQSFYRVAHARINESLINFAIGRHDIQTLSDFRWDELE